MICHGEIQYNRENGELVHSDICPHDCCWENQTEEWKDFVRKCLDEWLEKSNGTGHFFVGADLE